MITAIALDDEPLALQIIKSYCQKLDFIDLKSTFTETSEALKYLKQAPVNLIFLDINMPALSGLDFYRMVSKNTMVIFTTAHAEYAIEGFNLSAIDYLLKPFDFPRFKQAAEKARDYYAYTRHKEHTNDQFLFVRVDYSMIKVDITEITYIEGLDNYIKIHFDNKKDLLVRMSMKAIAEKLPAAGFVRVHRSFIVALKKITSVRNKTVYLDSMEIPIGTNYVEETMKLFKDTGS